MDIVTIAIRATKIMWYAQDAARAAEAAIVDARAAMKENDTCDALRLKCLAASYAAKANHAARLTSSLAAWAGVLLIENDTEATWWWCNRAYYAEGAALAAAQAATKAAAQAATIVS